MEQLIGGIITAALGAIGVLGVQFLKNIASRRENNIKVALHEQEQENAIKAILDNQNEIKKKLDIHNGYAERFVEIEKATIRIDDRLSSIESHVTDMENRLTKGGK